ncbi:hypothetical protein [Sandaracinus amylolyticus]|uniref:Uncharacterized protein n=1 Tax=Sandaracinus amylolyticus TaxID=927083 RepID=A0A0F6YI74_9BACT|nr:hypothetical protein [Sandaracinus amylolyticus]AKF05857.1 hypothetical protein DB32_003006 [Sandaracinus amylolyticus]
MSDVRVPSRERDVPDDEVPTSSELCAMLAPARLAPAGRDDDARDSLIDIVTTRHALVPTEPIPLAELERAPRRWVLAGASMLAVLTLSMIAFAAVPRLLAPDAQRERSITSQASTTPRARPPEVVAPAPIAVEPVTPSATLAPTAERVPAVRVRPHVAVVPDAARTRPSASSTSPMRTSDAPQRALDPAVASALESALSGGVDGEAREALPLLPAQRDVSTTLRALERRIAACRDGEGGIATAHLVIEGATGRVSRVDVRGDGADAACVATIVESATFPRFSRDELPVVYPYRL